jgi:hypothetical protein
MCDLCDQINFGECDVILCTRLRWREPAVCGGPTPYTAGHMCLTETGFLPCQSHGLMTRTCLVSTPWVMMQTCHSSVSDPPTGVAA